MILKRSRTLHRRSGDPKRLPKCHGVEGFVGPLSGKPRDGSPLAKLYFNSTSIPQSCAAPFQRVSCTVVWLTLKWKVHYLMWVLTENSVEFRKWQNTDKNTWWTCKQLFRHFSMITWVWNEVYFAWQIWITLMSKWKLMYGYVSNYDPKYIWVC